MESSTRFLLTTLVVVMVSMVHISAVAQQQPQYTMYMANNFILNPAIAGIEPYLDMKLSARSQWVGIDDAPKTMYISIHSPVSISNFQQGRSGIGGKIFVDKTGPIMLSASELNYAYHLPINRVYKLSFGIGAGLTNHRVNVSDIRLDDPNDPIFSLDRFSRTAPLVNVGMWFYSTDMFAGIAAHNLIENDYSLTNAVPGETGMGLRRHFFITGGYRLQIGDFYLTPSAMIKFVRPAPIGYDINLKGQFSDRFWAGMTWRHQDGMAAMLGFFITPSLNLAYSYDFLNSDLRRHSSGTHEVVIGININNQWGPRCPTIAW